MEQEEDQLHVQVVILPFFSQSHVKPMLRLAQLLSLATNFHITFVISDHIHDRLLRSNDMDAFLNTHPNIQFTSIPDGLPPDHPCRAGGSGMLETILSPTARPTTKSKFRQLLIDMNEKGKAEEDQQVTCIIADGLMSFAVDIGEELGIPVIAFRTFSASCTWIYLHLSKLAEEGILPLQAKEMDKVVTCISGLEGVLRHRDLPSICKLEADHPILQFFINETSRMARASSLILNTLNELEAPVISRFDSIFTKVYTIGPLHALSNTLLPSSLATMSFGSSLWKEDKSCIHWLDSQSPRSAVYVSFGSIAVLSHDRMLELLHGLVNSGKPFLWVMRPDMIEGQNNGLADIPLELEEGIKKRGFMVEWAPQEEVLSHPAIGVFLTHSGWSSTLEGIYAGVPMICWPFFGDQQVNSRLVSHMWKIGYDMKDACDRVIVEKTVRDLMEGRRQRDEIMRNMDSVLMKAQESIKEGGSSRVNLESLILHIRSMKSRAT